MSQQRNNQRNTQNNVKGPRTTNNGQVRKNTIPSNDRNIKDIQRNISENNLEKRQPSSNKNQSNKNKKKTKKAKKKRFRRTCLGFLLTMIIVVSVLGGIGAGIFVKVVKDSPNLDLISVEPNVYTSIVYDNNNQEIDRFHGKENREYVTLDEISVDLQNAIVSVEDERFYDHFGIDLRGIARAAYTTIKNKITGSTGVQGASTITQQLIKNNVTKVTRNTMETKIQEQYLAVTYEKHLEEKFGSKISAKKYILELYLNTIGLGHGYNGVQAAALGYFNKDAKDLTLAESACIAAITNNPSLYSPRTQPENNRKRVEKILNHMLEQNMITKSQYDEALAEDIYSKVSDGNAQKKVEGNVIHGYFEDALFEQVSKDLQEQHNISKVQADNLIYNGGLQIYSTKDSSQQNILDTTFANEELFPDVVYKYDVTYTVSVENSTTGKQEHKDYHKFVKTEEEGNAFVASKKEEIESGLSSDEKIIADKVSFSTQPQSSMVIMDYKTGNVTALIGGRGEKTVNRGFNRATDSKRQPGSVFKVLAAYAPAIDTGVLMPGSVIVDEPITIGNYSPKNWYGESYRGASTVREGIEQSMNILAVKAMNMVGVDVAYNYLLNFGFTTLENDNHLSTALGGITYGVTQMEVTAAYATIANGGKYYEPKLYTKVLDHDGNVILDTTTREAKQVIKETTAYMLTDMMEGVVTKGTGTAAKFKNISMPIAGKTGTTQETKDLTFVGYTPYYVAGVWFGYDRYDDIVPNMMAKVAGKRVIANDRYHLVLWREVMEKIHQDLPKASFGPKPSDIVEVAICLDSGLLATEECKHDPRGNRVVVDMFLKGTEPTEYCEEHQVVAICTESGKLAGDFCPEHSVELKSIFSFTDENPMPTEICDIHLEGSIGIEESETDQEHSTEQNIDDIINTTENLPVIINPSENTNQDGNTQSTTMPEEVGNIVPSVPQEQTTSEQKTEQKTEQPTQEETVGAPIFNTP